jgi:histidinol-phosphatase (PHP family)
MHDYHIHTEFSCDCQASMHSMCRSALARGLPEIGISDHFDMMPQDPCHTDFPADAWWDALQRCRKEFSGNLILRAGLEVGEPHLFHPQVQRILADYPWDYVLGSLHWVEGELISSASKFSASKDETFRSYFDEQLRMVLDGEFDILAHMDLIKRFSYQHYGPFQPQPYEDEIRAVLQACIRRGIALEVNSGTLRRSVRECMPSSTILCWYAEEGGELVTLGSDAHEPEHVAYGFDACLGVLHRAGLHSLCGFEKRRPSNAPLPTRFHAS